MKKITIVGLAAITAAALLFAACQKKAPAAAAADPNAPVTLTVWCWDPTNNIYGMNKAGEIYKRDHANVTVNVVETPWDDVQQKLITSLSAKQTANLPDIVLIQDNAIQKNVGTYPDAFLPVNGKVDLSKFAKFKLDVGNVNGKNYGVPFDNGATGTFLRRDIVEKAGLKVEDFNNITWERFIELGKIVKDKTGVTMVSTVANSPAYLMIGLQSAGSWFFKEDGSLYIKDNPVLLRSLEIMRDMINAGVLTLVADWNAYIATINNGTVAATIQGCWIMGSIVAETSQSGNWAMVSTPRFATIPESVNYSSQGGSGWVTLASSKNPDVALDFLDKTFAGSVELYEAVLPRGMVATWSPAVASPLYSQPNDFFGGQKIYSDLMGYAEKIPQVKYGVFNYEARDAVARAMTDILQGKTIAESLELADKNVSFLIGQ
ncbi:ABC transporter substrate-binding protein [Spirochaetia bacterium]|nr:ABC transporter substrate-binding protein [Spirochaetia bacterium]